MKPKTQVDEEGSQRSIAVMNESFPKPFYCGWSQRLMTNPVVHPNGESYEYEVAMEREPNVLYYPNRALKSIIQHEQQTKNELPVGTVEGPTFQCDAKILSNNEKLIHQNTTLSANMPSQSSPTALSSTSSSSLSSPLPDGYYCPITQEIMNDPVVDPEGNTFECKPLLEWLGKNQTSPLTRNRYNPPRTTPDTASMQEQSNQSDISNPNSNNAENDNNDSAPGAFLLYRNKALTDLLELERNKPSDIIHPTIRRWKEEMISQPLAVQLSSIVKVPNLDVSPQNNNDGNDTHAEDSTGNDEEEHAVQGISKVEVARVFVYGIMLTITLSFFVSRQVLYIVIVTILVITNVLSCHIHQLRRAGG